MTWNIFLIRTQKRSFEVCRKIMHIYFAYMNPYTLYFSLSYRANWVYFMCILVIVLSWDIYDTLAR